MTAKTKAQATADAVRMFDEVGHVRLPGAQLGPNGLSGAFGCYELCRHHVPKDAIGIVTHLWQFIATTTGAVFAPRLEIPGVEVAWSLVLEDRHIPGALRRVENTNDPQPPGTQRLPPYGSFTDLRHLWGASERIKLFVDEKTTVSLWVRVWAPGAQIRQVGGRLLGYTQLGGSPSSVRNMVQGM